MNELHSRGNVLGDRHASSLLMPHVCLRILSYSLSDQIPLPTFPMLVATFSSSFPLSLSFPYVPINLVPLWTPPHKACPFQLQWGRAAPGSHTLYTHSLHSLSLYQLGINLLKQRASWRAAHRGPCEVLPPHCSTLPPIPRMTHSSSLLPTVLATKQTGEKGDRRKASLSDHLDSGAMTDYKCDDHIKSGDFTILVRAAIAHHIKELRVSGKIQQYSAAFVQMTDHDPVVQTKSHSRNVGPSI